METAHLLKENVEAGGGRASQASHKLRFGEHTSKRAFTVHADSAASSSKTPREKRRVLGDISNQQRRRLSSGGGDDSAAHKKKKKKLKTLKSGSDRSSEVVRVKKAKVAVPEAQATPTAPAAVAAGAEGAEAAQATKVQEVEEIEHAYGGLLSPKPDASYLASLREEMLNDILNNKTRSLIDDMEPSDTFGIWDDADERAMLESGAAPSSWWSQATAEFAEDTCSDPLWNDADDSVPTEDEVPPPDELPDPSHDEIAHDDLLDELLSVDVDAACQ